METTWILIANGQKARCFERSASNHALTELADFVYPNDKLSGQIGNTDLTHSADKGHGRTAHAGTQFEVRTAAQNKSRNSFAKELADYLDDAVSSKRCTAWVLIAGNPMLGAIRQHLGTHAAQALKQCVARDLTQLGGTDLKLGVDRALSLPD